MSEGSFTAIVVNYRSGDHLGRCVQSLLEAGGPLTRVIVVDNSPGDPSIEPARLADSDHVTVIDAPHNLGLAGGVNFALQAVDTPYLVVLNPDVTVGSGWLSPLEVPLAEGAAVACPLIRMAGTDQINSLGMTIHVSALGFNRLWGTPVAKAPPKSHAVGGLHGAAFAIRTDVLRELGGWDETGFLYHEDVALSWDVLLAGHSIVAVPKSVVDHAYHLTMYPEKLYLLERNRWALLLSHLRWTRLALLSPVLLGAEVAVWAMTLVRGRRFLGAKARSYGWLLQNRRQIGDWRRLVMSRTRYDARSLSRHTTWTVPLNQVMTVSQERGKSARVPEGGLPSEPTLG